MTSTNANIINSFTLIVIGLWGYFDVSAPTALIPVGFGAALILCSNGVKKQNKVVAHIAVLLTFIILRKKQKYFIKRYSKKSLKCL